MRGALRNYRLSSMGDLDKTLNLLQNKTRRLILERLVREPHYPMQLAELIGTVTYTHLTLTTLLLV